MSEHLSPSVLNALADGELSADQLTLAKEHLDSCQQCTSGALNEALLKNAVARAGQRYAPSSDLQERVARFLAQPDQPQPDGSGALAAKWSKLSLFSGWAVAACLLIVFVIWTFTQLHGRQPEQAALAAEACDLHVAAMAGSALPQVVSSDRHTVKPWFQGKLPFSFNLPENLPGDTKLEGADLVYVQGRPAAQLLYSIGRHQVSIFIQNNPGTEAFHKLPAERAGFHIAGLRSKDLSVITVSDVDPARLSDLAARFQQAQ